MRDTVKYRTADGATRMLQTARLRTVLALALCLGLVAAACGPQEQAEDADVVGDPDTADAHLRMMWWGSDVRHALTNEAVEAFHEQHDVSVETEFMGWDGYWDRIATLVAGGNAPEVMQQDYRYLSEYAGRGAIIPMDEFVPDPLGVDDWPDEILGSGILSDQLFGVPWAVNTQALIYDPEALEEAGLELPDTTTWTWDEFADFAQEISDNTDENTYGVADAGGWEPFLDLWLISHGKALYTEDGELGFEEEDLVEYWQFWTDLRESGAATPADITATHDAQPENSAIVNEQAVLDYLWSNQITAWSETAGRHLELAHWPQGSEGTGSYIKASLLLSITSDADHPEESAMLNTGKLITLMKSTTAPCSGSAPRKTRSTRFPAAPPIIRPSAVADESASLNFMIANSV
jgi:multiple sugar transport system substrate-binding protein